MKLRVGVIFGGESVEHEVSIISAVQAMKALDGDKYEIVPIYIAKNREWYTGRLLKDLELYKDIDNLKRYAKNVVLYNKNNTFVLQSKKGFKRIVDQIDLALPVVHGTNVEDGTLQGYLELIGIPYAESNVYASSVGQDKVFQKQIFGAEKLPIVDYVWFFENEYLEDSDRIKKDIKKLGYPVIVKPARLGSSIGISKVKDESKIDEAIENATKYDNKIIVEKVVENLVEINCSVLGNYESFETSNLEEVMGRDEFLSYRDKYLGGSKVKGMAATNRVIPARISDKLTNEIKELAKKVARVLNVSGVVRIDFLLDSKENKVYINEINTIPGSLSFYLWDKNNKDYTKLLDDIITITIKNYKKRSNITYSFDTNILQNHSGLKGMKGKLKL
jgi:D-alanine-D-alanine ligase